jgi:serine/threonine protein kinase
VQDAVEQVLQAHLAIAAAGWVAGDLYDGCVLYDEATARMSLVDLDEYRPRPFLLHGDRAPGSTRYMAPEEFRRGALIDHRTTVFALGRTAYRFLTGVDGWRASRSSTRSWPARPLLIPTSGTRRCRSSWTPGVRSWRGGSSKRPL